MKDWYMLVRKGLPQRLLVHGDLYWPVTETFEDAKKLAKYIAKLHSVPDIRPYQIGSATGDSLEVQLTLALQEGCAAVICVGCWVNDKPKWKWLPFD
jgi:hypothetical protein